MNKSCKNRIKKWVYRLKDGTFYKEGTRESWSLVSAPYRKKEVVTNYMPEATFFDKPLDTPPYTSFMKGGKWIAVTINETYEWTLR